MSRSTSPVPRFVSSSPVPQQITEDSWGEIHPVSLAARNPSFPSSVPSDSFPTQSFPMSQGQIPMTLPRTALLGQDLAPPAVNPLLPQPSFPEQSFDPFMPLPSSFSMSASQVSSVPASPPTASNVTIPLASPSPSSMGFQPVTMFPSMGIVPATMPPGNMSVPETLPPAWTQLSRDFTPSMGSAGIVRASSPSIGMLPASMAAPPTATYPSMGAAPGTFGTLPPSIMTIPRSTIVDGNKPFVDPFYAPAPAVTRTRLDDSLQNPFLAPQTYNYSTGNAVEDNAALYKVQQGAHQTGWLSRMRSTIKHVPSDGREVTDKGPDDGNAGLMFFVCGFFGSLMLILIPVWDGISLLHDPVWMYMAGGRWPSILIACSVSIPVLFTITVIMLGNCGHRSSGSTSEQTLLGAAVLFVLFFGCMLLVVSMPIAEQALAYKADFLSSCKTGAKTHALYAEYQVLQKLRSDSACADMVSVEECSGYKETSQSITLRNFEESLTCAGFCYYPKVANSTANLYPPALFTKAAFQGSCSAMAARNMESFVSDMSRQLMFEGFFLMGASVLQGFLMLFGNVAKKDHPRKAGYGSMQAPAKELPATTDGFSNSGGDFRRRPTAMY